MLSGNRDQTTLGAIVQALPDPVFVVDEFGRYVDVVGGSPDNARSNVVGKSLHDLLPSEVADELLASIHDSLARNAPGTEQYCTRDGAAAAGREQWFEVRISPLPDAPGQPRRVVWLNTDITQRKRLEHRLEQLSLTDRLTDTYTEKHFRYLLDEEINRQARYHEPFCLLLLELDHAEAVRTEYGADTADSCIRDLARLIRLELRHSDVLGRLGHDRFAILLINTPMNWSLQVGQRIVLRAARMPFAAPGRTLHLSVSGGLTDFRNEDSADVMRHRAQQALTKSQSAGRDRVSVG